MSNQPLRRILTTVALGATLALFPVGQAGATETAAATCTWQETVWEVPEASQIGRIDGYDGSRYAVGVTGWRPSYDDGPFHKIIEPRGTLWDDGNIVLRADGQLPYFRDVNASGLVVGSDYVDQRFYGVTIDHDGQTTRLPANPEWTSYTANRVNNAGDIAGWASIGTRDILVVWPGNAPGTYRELPVPDIDYHNLTDMDEQGRIIIGASSGQGGGYVVDPSGQWRLIASQGTDGYSFPYAIRDGHIVGETYTGADDGGVAAEWDAQGELIRTIDAWGARSIGGNGTVAGYDWVDGNKRVVLWRDGVVVDQPIPVDFSLTALSDDERTIVGVGLSRKPAHYRCS